VKIRVQVFGVVTPCSVVVGYQHFRGPCYLHLPWMCRQHGPPELWCLTTLYGVTTENNSTWTSQTCYADI